MLNLPTLLVTSGKRLLPNHPVGKVPILTRNFSIADNAIKKTRRKGKSPHDNDDNSYFTFNIVSESENYLFSRVPPSLALKLVDFRIFKSKILPLTTDEMTDLTYNLVDVVARNSDSKISCFQIMVQRLFAHELKLLKGYPAEVTVCPKDHELRIRRLLNILIHLKNPYYSIDGMNDFAVWSKTQQRFMDVNQLMLQFLVDIGSWENVRFMTKTLAEPTVSASACNGNGNGPTALLPHISELLQIEESTGYYGETVLWTEEKLQLIPASFHRKMIESVLLPLQDDASLKKYIHQILSISDNDSGDLSVEEILLICIHRQELEAAKYISSGWLNGSILGRKPTFLSLAMLFDRLHFLSESNSNFMTFYSWFLKFTCDNHSSFFRETFKLDLDLVSLDLLIDALNVESEAVGKVSYEKLVSSLDFQETDRVVSLIEKHPKIMLCPTLFIALAKKSLQELKNYVLFDRVRNMVTNNNRFVVHYPDFIEYCLREGDQKLAVDLYREWFTIRHRVWTPINETVVAFLPAMLKYSLENFDFGLAASVVEIYATNEHIKVSEDISGLFYEIACLLSKNQLSEGAVPEELGEESKTANILHDSSSNSDSPVPEEQVSGSIFVPFHRSKGQSPRRFLENLINLALRTGNQHLGSVSFETSRFTRHKISSENVVAFISMIYRTRGLNQAFETYKLYLNNETPTDQGEFKFLSQEFFQGIMKMCFKLCDSEFSLSILQDIESSYERYLEPFYYTIVISTIAMEISSSSYHNNNDNDNDNDAIGVKVDVGEKVKKAEAIWERANTVRPEMVNNLTISAMLDVYESAARVSSASPKRLRSETQEIQSFISGFTEISGNNHGSEVNDRVVPLESPYIQKAIKFWSSKSSSTSFKLNVHNCLAYWRVLSLCKGESEIKSLFEKSIQMINSDFASSSGNEEDRFLWSAIFGKTFGNNCDDAKRILDRVNSQGINFES